VTKIPQFISHPHTIYCNITFPSESRLPNFFFPTVRQVECFRFPLRVDKFIEGQPFISPLDFFKLKICTKFAFYLSVLFMMSAQIK
jgi:hypothetical protein